MLRDQILRLLDQGTLAPEQIATHLGVDEADARDALEEMRRRGLADVASVTVVGNEPRPSPAHWRITHGGKIRLELQRKEGAG